MHQSRAPIEGKGIVLQKCSLGSFYQKIDLRNFDIAPLYR